jgi:diacylglycerol kinase family enzyme
MDVEESKAICLDKDHKQVLLLEGESEGHRLPKVDFSTVPSGSRKWAATLVPNSFSRVYVIVSILSGTQLAASFFESVLKPVLDALGLEGEYIVEHTRSAKTISEVTNAIFLNNAKKGITQLIILLSGDGGVVDILNSLHCAPQGSDYVPPEISIIPMGTGNALANSTGVNNDQTLGLSTLARGRGKDLPIFKATFSPGARALVDEARQEEELPLKNAQGHPFMYGAVVCSWGMHASLVADSDTAEYRKFGIERFKMAANEALFPKDGSGPHRYRARVSILPTGTTEWKEVDRAEHAYVLVTLVSNLESTFTISPHSKPLNGTLRIVHFGPQSGDEIMRLMGLAYQNGKHVEEGSVSYEEVDAVRISFEGREGDGRWRRICCDGKIVKVETDGWVEIRREDTTLLKLRHLGD